MPAPQAAVPDAPGSVGGLIARGKGPRSGWSAPGRLGSAGLGAGGNGGWPAPVPGQVGLAGPASLAPVTGQVGLADPASLAPVTGQGGPADVAPLAPELLRPLSAGPGPAKPPPAGPCPARPPPTGFVPLPAPAAPVRRLARHGTAEPPGQRETWPSGRRDTRLADGRGTHTRLAAGRGTHTRRAHASMCGADRRTAASLCAAGSGAGLGLGRTERFHPCPGVPRVAGPVLRPPGLFGRIRLGRHQPGGGHHPPRWGTLGRAPALTTRPAVRPGGRRKRWIRTRRLGTARPCVLRQFLPGRQFGAHLLTRRQWGCRAAGRRGTLSPGQFAVRLRGGLPGRSARIPAVSAADAVPE